MKRIIIMVIFTLIFIISGCTKNKPDGDEVDTEIIVEEETDTEVIKEKEPPTLYPIRGIFYESSKDSIYLQDNIDQTVVYKLKVYEPEKNQKVMSFFQPGDILQVSIDIDEFIIYEISLLEVNRETQIENEESENAVLNEEDGISILVNDVIITYDVAPQNIDGYIMLPLRFTIREFGFLVRWHPEEESIDCIKGNIFIRMKVGENAYYLNDDDPIELKNSPIVKDGRTMVPILVIRINSVLEFQKKMFNEVDKKYDCNNRVIVVTPE